MTLLLIALAAATLGGCSADRAASRSPWHASSLDRSSLDDRPLVDHRGRSRSLVFSPRRLQARVDQAPGLPWYAARADARLATQSGVASPSVTLSRTYTVDRQSFHGDRPHHHFHRTRHQVEVTQGVR